MRTGPCACLGQRCLVAWVRSHERHCTVVGLAAATAGCTGGTELAHTLGAGVLELDVKMCAEQFWSLVSPRACTRVREAEAVAQGWCRRRCPRQRGADPGRLSLLSSALTVLGPLSSLQLQDETDFPLAKES